MQIAMTMPDDYRIDHPQQMLNARCARQSWRERLQFPHSGIVTIGHRGDAQTVVTTFAVEVPEEILGVAGIEADEADALAHGVCKVT
jgi:hypothetical protein